MTGADGRSGARYGTLMIGPPWVMPMGVIVAPGVGTSMTILAVSPIKLKVSAWHESVELAVLALALLRLASRAARGAPPLPVSMPRWQRWAAHGEHGALYLMMLALPVTGGLQASAAGFPLS